MTVRPPLNALHVFFVVVQEGGFRQAAQALHLTPGAVSRQIQTLEERLKEVLFDRGVGNSATLTKAGRRLHERIADKMTGIIGVLDAFSSNRRQVSLLVDTSVTLAMHWLIPQLLSFRQRYPYIHVQVRTVDGDINPSAPVDIFLRRDASELRGLPSQIFMAERSVLVASPHFSSTLNSQRSNNLLWLSDVPRISTRSRPDLWTNWCSAHGLSTEALEPALEFDNTVLAIQAAIQGLGILVVPEAFILGMLESGALESMHASRIETGSYSFAVGRRQASSRVAIFTDWLKERGSKEIRNLL